MSDQLGSAKYFFTFDLASGFRQIRMAQEDAHKTAFSIPYGQFQFKRMSLGLKNAPTTFQPLMNSVLSELQGVELFIRLDDINREDTFNNFKTSAPIDKGALEMKKIGRLPHYERLMLERASLNQDSEKYIVSLLVKEDRNIPIRPENLLNSLRYLLDVVNEKQLTSFSNSKGNSEEILCDTQSRNGRKYLWKNP
ncbi:uncharacterized protein LOC112213408 [Bombus impatiens]|uniref:Uncharacterized protein LOC112213408 n=1 Tax=Bombus impatiens TaxID=132113 RepID=A0A6P6FE71_BOMIM|nr:uncharacterized protein LOC112213408 [Bombus impatiens]